MKSVGNGDSDAPRGIRVRRFFALFLFAVVAVPLAISGFIAAQKSERTAVAEVRLGNQRAATSVAGQVEEYLEGERKLIGSMGEASIQMRERAGRNAVLNSFLVNHHHITRAAIFDKEGAVLVGDAALNTGLQQALIGESSIVAVEQKEGTLSVGQVVLWAEPLLIAKNVSGAIVAEVDLVGLWGPINSIRVGRTGYVSLVTTKGKMLAHGKADQRGKVYSEGSIDPKLLRAAESGAMYERPDDGDELIVTSASVKSLGSVVLIEQSSSEALAAVGGMKIWLYVFFLIAIAAALILGMFFSRQVVRPLEKLGKHVEELGRGDLSKRVDVTDATRLGEVRDLSTSINKMATELEANEKERMGRERLNAFARVAAGLAHDLRHPIESVRMACHEYVANPDHPDNLSMMQAVTKADIPRLKKFVDDLQGLAKTGTLALELFEHSSLTLAEESVFEIQAAPKWGGVIDFSLEGIDMEIRVDGGLVKRALYNLMNNAGEACLGEGTNTGSVGLLVEMVDENSPLQFDEPMVAFRVTDKGCGIEPERIGDILSADFKSTKRSSGVGLGLGVVRQVAESHGGKVGIESELGVGSTFTMYLPPYAEPNYDNLA